MDDTCNAYDAVPYQGGTFPQTHPQHLATLGTLFGMTPPDVETCRVLELGCAEGGNLIPLAAELPTALFTGIDNSANQIRAGQQTLADVGLSNIELRHGDIRELDASLGTFDYVIAHGVYSWVPADVRTRILEICRDHLAENGIAIVSFIAKPGGHFRRMIREMLLYHTRRVSEPALRVAECRRFLDFLIESAPQGATAYREVLEWERRHVRQCLDHQLLHDLLEEVNEPVAIADFMEQAERHELQYLGDADFSSMLARNLGPRVVEQLRACCRTLVDVEQYMDFVRNRAFRQTLLCRRSIPLVHQVDPRVIQRLFIGGRLIAKQPNVEFTSRGPCSFHSADGSEIKTSSPVSKAAFAVLADIWPGNLPFGELLSAAQSRLSSAGRSPAEPIDADAKELCDCLFTCYSNRLVEFSVRRNGCAATIPPFPVATALARTQAVRGEIVANLRHETIRLQPLQRALLQELDGTHTAESLCDRIAVSRQGRIRLDHSPHGLQAPHAHRGNLAAQVHSALRELAELGLLLR